jgi:radical SAM superfamily enzyme
LGDLPVDGVKVHLQYVIEGTALARMHEQGAYRCLDMDEYVDLVADFLERIPADMVIQRLTGDPMASERVAPSWCWDKAGVLNAIRKRLEERDTWQGKIYRPLPAGRSNGTG